MLSTMHARQGFSATISCVTAWLAISFILPGISGDAFCSVEKLQYVALIDRNIEQILLRNLSQISTTSVVFSSILTLLNEYNLIRQEEQREDIISIVGNPLHAFQIIRRLTISVPEIQDMIRNTHTELWSALETQRLAADVSTLKDLNGAVAGLIRLQKTYLLYSHDLVDGKVWNVQTKARLTLFDCLYISMTAKQDRMLEFAAEWGEAAEYRMNEIRDISGQAVISSVLQGIKSMHDEVFIPDIVSPGTYAKFYAPLKNISAKIQRQTQFANKLSVNFNRANWGNAWEYEAALCRGQRFLTNDEEAQLSCVTIAGPHPFFYIQPHRVEIQSLDPLVATIHDVVRERKGQLIRSLGSRILQRSTVVGPPDDPRQISNSRISMTAWLTDSHPEIHKLSQRISLITGMNMAEAGSTEQFQVVNYGIAGQYNHHVDFFHRSEEEVISSYNNIDDKGDRIATFLVYLSDVKQGGATAFLSAGVAVKPIKGAATFWYNLDTDGNGSQKTKHAGCPVVTGSKWIANKWFLEKAQMFQKPCPLSPGITHSFDTPPESPDEILRLLQ